MARNNYGAVFGAVLLQGIFTGTRYIPDIAFLTSEDFAILRSVLVGLLLVVVLILRPESSQAHRKNPWNPQTCRQRAGGQVNTKSTTSFPIGRLRRPDDHPSEITGTLSATLSSILALGSGILRSDELAGAPGTDAAGGLHPPGGPLPRAPWFGCACLSDQPMQALERALGGIPALPSLVEVWSLVALVALASALLATAPRARARAPSPAVLQRFLL